MKLKGDLPIPRDVIETILESSIPYEEAREDEKVLRSVLTKLTASEVEVAAQTSYAYWLATLTESPPTEVQRERMAVREIRRTLFRNPLPKGLELIQQTMKLRTEKRIDLIRSCFMKHVEYDSPEDERKASELRTVIEEEIGKQIVVVGGHDQHEGYAILTFLPRTAVGTDHDLLTLILYSMERALAVTEYSTRAKYEKIMVVLDFGTFDSSVAPSWTGTKTVALTLQHHFPQRLKRLVLLDPPFWIRTLYTMVSPFLDPATKKKFNLCSGPEEKINLMNDLVTPEQAMPLMRPDGKLTSMIQTAHYLTQVPFHLGYCEDENNNNKQDNDRNNHETPPTQSANAQDTTVTSSSSSSPD